MVVAPVMVVDPHNEVPGGIEFLVTEHVLSLRPSHPLDGSRDSDGPREDAPDGNPWPTTIVTMEGGYSVRVKGTPQMILRQWFGAPSNERRIIAPTVAVPGVKLQ